MTHTLESLRFPVGRFTPKADPTPEDRRHSIEHIAHTPARLRAALEGLDAARLDTPYRPGGWTVRQLVHHVPDSHMNALIRFKLALTEEQPTIRPYDQAAWAELADSQLDDPDIALSLLDALHARWVALLESLNDDDWARPLVHPEIGDVTIDFLLQLYAWHGQHHVAHVTRLREREGW
jgi:uncharacterized damage-inducible protein DinB